MSEFFTAEFFAANRQRLRELFVGTAPIVITAHGQQQRNGDTSHRFTQDRDFWYLTGIDEPDIILVMDKGKEYLMVPDRHRARQIFYGLPTAETLSQTSGIKDVLFGKDGWDRLNRRLHKVKHLATVAPQASFDKVWAVYANPARRRLLRQLTQANPNLELLDLRPQLSLMRMVKQPPELAALQAAIDITVKSIKYVQKRRYSNERLLANDLDWQFVKNGADGAGFETLVSHGAANTVIHAHPSNQPIKPRELILVDVGAEVEHYSADISRTYTPDPPTKRQRDVHAAVAAVQDFACSLVKPGSSIRENELKIEQFMGEKLRELGLIKSISRETVREFYPHATSHYLGLDVHDVGDYQRPLEANMVLTIEPGIYIPKEGIGVRIEDDVLVTKTGYRNLSRRLPRDLA